MKKMLALALTLFTANLLFGQMKFGVGVRGNLDVPAGATLHEDFFNKRYYDVALFEGVGFGFAASAVLTQADMKGLNLTLEAGYAHNEIGWEYDASKLNMKGKISYSSIDVPILVGYTFASGNFRLTPQVGPYLSLPIGTVRYDIERIESDDKLVSNKTYSETFDIGSRFLFGGMGGVSVGYKVGNGLVNFDARFMADINQLKVDVTKKDVSLLTRRKVTLGLGYTFFF